MSRRGSKKSPDQSRSEGLTTDEFLKGLEELKRDLKREIKREISDQISAALSGQIKDLKKQVENQAHEIEVLKKVAISAERRKLHEQRVMLSANVIIRGMDESEDESEKDLIQKVDDILEKLQVDAPVLEVARVGRKDGERSRLIRVTTTDFEERNRILKYSKVLRSMPAYKGIYLDVDKPALDRKEAARLRMRAKQLKIQNPEKIVKIFRRTLLLDGNEVDKEEPLRHIFPSL